MKKQIYYVINLFNMMSKTKKTFRVLIIGLVFFVSSCYSLNFTSENVMKLKQGMTSSEVVEIFGNPKKTEATTCGGATKQSWTCIIWYYGDYTPRLYFEGKDGVLYLNSWFM